MKKLLQIILFVFAALIAVFVSGGFLLPSDFTIEVEAEVEAPLENMFALANAPATWVEWSAWSLDSMPDMKSTYTGPDSGKGARWSWQQEMGNGWLQITESAENQRIGYELVFGDATKPWTGSILFAPSGDKTLVRWSFGGDLGNNLLGRWMMLGMVDVMEEEHSKGIEGLAAAAQERVAVPQPAAGDDDSAGD